jgi:uncharacterized protein YbaR (Trm112 family)
VNEWLLDRLACPPHQRGLSAHGNNLTCPEGCRFPVVDGVPVMLLEEAEQTMDLAQTSLRQTREPNTDGGLYIDSVGLTDEEKDGIRRLSAERQTGIDPVASFLVGATNGIAYKTQIGRLSRYPIPELRAPSRVADSVYVSSVKGGASAR